MGRGEGFAGASDAEEGLAILARFEAADELDDGARLIAGGSEGGDDLEGEGHAAILCAARKCRPMRLNPVCVES